MCDLPETVQPRSFIIVFEGINGSGKSTRIKDIEKDFKSVGKKVKVYKFPDLESDEHLRTLLETGVRGYELESAFIDNILRKLPEIKEDMYKYDFLIFDRFWLSWLVYVNARDEITTEQRVELVERIAPIYEIPVDKTVFMKTPSPVAYFRIKKNDREKWRKYSIEELELQSKLFLFFIDHFEMDVEYIKPDKTYFLVKPPK